MEIEMEHPKWKNHMAQSHPMPDKNCRSCPRRSRCEYPNAKCLLAAKIHHIETATALWPALISVLGLAFFAFLGLLSLLGLRLLLPHTPFGLWLGVWLTRILLSPSALLSSAAATLSAAHVLVDLGCQLGRGCTQLRSGDAQGESTELQSFGKHCVDWTACFLLSKTSAATMRPRVMATSPRKSWLGSKPSRGHRWFLTTADCILVRLRLAFNYCQIVAIKAKLILQSIPNRVLCSANGGRSWEEPEWILIPILHTVHLCQRPTRPFVCPHSFKLEWAPKLRFWLYLPISWYSV